MFKHYIIWKGRIFLPTEGGQNPPPINVTLNADPGKEKAHKTEKVTMEWSTQNEKKKKIVQWIRNSKINF